MAILCGLQLELMRLNNPKGFLTFTQAVYIVIMSRPATIFTGLVVSGAILYHFRAELSSDMRQVRNQLSDVQNRLAGSVPGSKISNALTSHPTASILEKPKEMLDQSTEYVQNRILPSVKDTWNAHLIDFAQNVNELDTEKIQKAVKDVKDKWL
ncbi:hypothetical protein BGX34_006645 [Mortierella sp. NVP85]|nr:hypothetical protein BGX34_006645 [Mortierella sp. NVP85]